MSEYEPITAELRRYMEAYKPTVDGEHVEIARIGTIGYGGFVEHCDAIDAIHANLERENESLRRELDRVLGEQEEHAHTMGESIANELREYALGWDERNRVRCDLTAIADRIDAEHERTLAAATLVAGIPMTDENMAEHGWVRLPVDADGVPWHIGDITESGQTVEAWAETVPKRPPSASIGTCTAGSAMSAPSRSVRSESGVISSPSNAGSNIGRQRGSKWGNKPPSGPLCLKIPATRSASPIAMANKRRNQPNAFQP